MQEYVCHYYNGSSFARAVYHADNLATAMAAHNHAMPQFRDKVMKWVGPSGITFHMHDSKLSLDS